MQQPGKPLPDMTFKLRPDAGEGASYGKLWAERTSGREDRKCKGPGMRNAKESMGSITRKGAHGERWAFLTIGTVGKERPGRKSLDPSSYTLTASCVTGRALPPWGPGPPLHNGRVGLSGSQLSGKGI